jgi:flagellar FliL protein
MAEASADGTDAEVAPVKKKGPGAIVWLLLLVVAAIGGFAVPFLLPDSTSTSATEEDEVPFEMRSDEETISIPFGDVTVNLDEGRMNRYLRLKIAVLIAKEEEQIVTEAITAKTAILKSWLLSHLSDKTLEEIRGTAGLNMLRREIRREFNETLFSDRRDRVYDVLFEEFNVQ